MRASYLPTGQGIHTRVTQARFRRRPSDTKNRQQPTPRRTIHTHTTAYGVPGRILKVLYRHEEIGSPILPTPNPPSLGLLTNAAMTLSHESQLRGQSQRRDR